MQYQIFTRPKDVGLAFRPYPGAPVEADSPTLAVAAWMAGIDEDADDLYEFVEVAARPVGASS